MQDKGGRNQWSQYSLASGSSSGAAGSSSSAAAGKSSAAAASEPPPSASASSSSHPFSQPKYQGGGYVPARTPSPTAVAAQQRKQQEEYHKAQSAAAAAAIQAQQPQPTPNYSQPALPVPSSIADVPTPTVTAAPAPEPTPTPASMSANGNIVTRVRALHTFEPTEPGELAFEKGDIIKVVDRGYKDWWRGQLKGRTGIFPVNYVVRRTYCFTQPSSKGSSYRNPCQNPRRQKSHGRLSRKRLSFPRRRTLTSC